MNIQKNTAPISRGGQKGKVSGRRSTLLHLSGLPLSYLRRVVATKFTTSNSLLLLYFNYIIFIPLCQFSDIKHITLRRFAVI